MLVAAAFLAALLMGFANQRGGTCTVAAIEEILDKGRYRRFVALLEASAWVAGALLLLRAIFVLPALPHGYAYGGATIIGGVLFGLGAVLNRACIFGSIARLGSGDWAYLLTPLGFFLGALLGVRLPAPSALEAGTFLMNAPVWLGLVIGAAFLTRLFGHGHRVRRIADARIRHAWSPHAATIVIGLASLGGLLTAGAWTYSELLTDVARGHGDALALRIALNVALVAGAVLGGWTAGKLRPVMPDMRTAARTFFGGVIMGLGATLIPGGNTGLILIGVPLLQPYAWLAFLVICLTIFIAIRLSRRRVSGRSLNSVDERAGLVMPLRGISRDKDGARSPRRPRQRDVRGGTR